MDSSTVAAILGTTSVAVLSSALFYWKFVCSDNDTAAVPGETIIPLLPLETTMVTNSFLLLLTHRMAYNSQSSALTVIINNVFAAYSVYILTH